MKTTLLLVLTFLSSICFGQNPDTLNTTTRVDSLNRFAENKNIGLSHITADIISFSQLMNSHELTIENIRDWEIVSYDLIYFIPEGNSVNIYAGMGSKIPDDIIEKIIASGSNRIVLENIVISRKGESDKAGYRNFYLN